jgi:hypothetical protein
MTRRLLLSIAIVCAMASAASVTTSGADGRWKIGTDGGCYFDPTDDGPDQCTRGRWRVDAYGGCYFDAFDSGPDQCAPGSAP